MGQIGDDFDLSSEYFSFSKKFKTVAGNNVYDVWFKTHLEPDGAPPKGWLKSVLNAASLIGMKTIKYTERSPSINVVEFTFEFTSRKDHNAMQVMVNRVRHEKGGFRLPLYLEPHDDDVVVDSYVEAIRHFCGEHGIEVGFKELSSVRIDVIFDSSSDFYTVHSALAAGGEIDEMRKLIYKQGMPKLADFSDTLGGGVSKDAGFEIPSSLVHDLGFLVPRLGH